MGFGVLHHQQFLLGGLEISIVCACVCIFILELCVLNKNVNRLAEIDYFCARGTVTPPSN